MRCRGSVARREPASTRKRSGRQLGELFGTHRPHARRRQLDREGHTVEPDAQLGDGGAVRLVELEVGLRGAGALHEELHRGHVGELVEREVRTSRNRKGWHRPHQLGGDAERLAAGGQDLHVGTPLQHLLDELAGGVEHVLAVVEHEQHRPRRQQLDDRLVEGAARPLLHVERGRERGRDRALVAHRRELDQAHAVGEVVGDGAGEAVREARLAHAARTEQREDAPGLEQARRELEVTLAPDQRGRLHREHVAAGPRVLPLARHVRRHPGEVVARVEDGGFELAELRRRLEPEVVAQRGAELLREAQRLGLAAAAVEGEHRLAGELLAQAGGRGGGRRPRPRPRRDDRRAAGRRCASRPRPAAAPPGAPPRAGSTRSRRTRRRRRPATRRGRRRGGRGPGRGRRRAGHGPRRAPPRSDRRRPRRRAPPARSPAPGSPAWRRRRAPRTGAAATRSSAGWRRPSPAARPTAPRPGGRSTPPSSGRRAGPRGDAAASLPRGAGARCHRRFPPTRGRESPRQQSARPPCKVLVQRRYTWPTRARAHAPPRTIHETREPRP